MHAPKVTLISPRAPHILSAHGDASFLGPRVPLAIGQPRVVSWVSIAGRLIVSWLAIPVSCARYLYGVLCLCI